jgi:hypothetical protein
VENCLAGRGCQEEVPICRVSKKSESCRSVEVIIEFEDRAGLERGGDVGWWRLGRNRSETRLDLVVIRRTSRVVVGKSGTKGRSRVGKTGGGGGDGVSWLWWDACSLPRGFQALPGGQVTYEPNKLLAT